MSSWFQLTSSSVVASAASHRIVRIGSHAALEEVAILLKVRRDLTSDDVRHHTESDELQCCRNEPVTICLLASFHHQSIRSSTTTK